MCPYTDLQSNCSESVLNYLHELATQATIFFCFCKLYDIIQTLQHKIISLNRSDQSTCTWTVIPHADQIFQKLWSGEPIFQEFRSPGLKFLVDFNLCDSTSQVGGLDQEVLCTRRDQHANR